MILGNGTLRFEIIDQRMTKGPLHTVEGPSPSLMHAGSHITDTIISGLRVLPAQASALATQEFQRSIRRVGRAFRSRYDVDASILIVEEEAVQEGIEYGARMRRQAEPKVNGVRVSNGRSSRRQ